VAVLGHVRPDGDCIGSQVALVRVLRACGCDAVAVNEHSVPRNLSSFVGDTPFFLPVEVPDLGERIPVSVDCATQKRLGQGVLSRIGKVLLNLDHHVSNERFAQENHVVPAACATAEVLGCLFLNGQLPIDAVTAQALYVGIATDTGQFRFSSTTAKSFELSCQLIRMGAEPAKAAAELYENEPFSKVQLLRCFLESLRFEFGGRVCIGTLAEDVWEKTGATTELAEGLVDYARDIEGVQIGVCLELRKDTVKGSLRAKDEAMRVDRLAAILGGGGHACAAGFNCELPPERFMPLFMDKLAEIFGTTDNVS
jgi:phosphoesterase RecJ-like protein